jgi:hypothetical protein
VARSRASIELLAYGLEPTDPHEPNDTPATATAVLLERAGDGVSGAIEHTGDVDYFRFGCAADFVEAMRLELVSDFDRAIVLRADGSDFPPGVESDPVACGATVSVRTTDGSAGPSQHSNYAILAVPSRLYELDAVAQGLVTAAPTARGSVTLPANRSRLVRLTFPSAPQADLRYVELGGAGVEGNVRLHVLVDGELVGVSTRRDLFAAGTASLALSAVAPADLDAVERAAIGVVWSCEGPCVADAYRPGTVIARLTNLSSSPRTLQVFAYGTREADLNEPNDRPQDATEVTIAFEGDSVSGAIERIGDVDHFRFACGAGFGDLQLTLRSEFRGDIVMRLPSGQEFGPNQPRVVPCDALVAVTYARRDGGSLGVVAILDRGRLTAPGGRQPPAPGGREPARRRPRACRPGVAGRRSAGRERRLDRVGHGDHPAARVGRGRVQIGSGGSRHEAAARVDDRARAVLVEGGGDVGSGGALGAVAGYQEQDVGHAAPEGRDARSAGGAHHGAHRDVAAVTPRQPLQVIRDVLVEPPAVAGDEVLERRRARVRGRHQHEDRRPVPRPRASMNGSSVSGPGRARS